MVKFNSAKFSLKLSWRFLFPYRKERKACPTKRAPDVWDSAAFSSIFLVSSFSCSRIFSQPAHTRVTQAVGTPLADKFS
jgi:hypothetical protein